MIEKQKRVVSTIVCINDSISRDAISNVQGIQQEGVKLFKIIFSPPPQPLQMRIV